MKLLTYVLVSATCAFASFGLWGMLNLLDHTSVQTGKALPAFTSLVVSLRGWLLVAPLPVVAYAVYQLSRRSAKDASLPAFLACSMSIICLIGVPAMFALFLPCVLLMEQTWTK